MSIILIMFNKIIPTNRLNLTILLIIYFYIAILSTIVSNFIMKNTTILQWNLDSYNKKCDHLKLLVRDYSPQIICLQETQFKPSDVIRLKNYEILRKDYTEGDRACGGIAVFIRNTIHYESLNIVSPLQVMAAKVFYTITYTICNVYFPPSKNVQKIEILNITNQLEAPYIILGDMNAHSTTWRSQINNQKGKIIESILNENNNLVLLNQIGVTTHFNLSSRTESIIDLVLSSASLSTS